MEVALKRDGMRRGRSRVSKPSEGMLVILLQLNEIERRAKNRWMKVDARVRKAHNCIGEERVYASINQHSIRFASLFNKRAISANLTHESQVEKFAWALSLLHSILPAGRARASAARVSRAIQSIDVVCERHFAPVSRKHNNPDLLLAHIAFPWSRADHESRGQRVDQLNGIPFHIERHRWGSSCSVGRGHLNWSQLELELVANGPIEMNRWESQLSRALISPVLAPAAEIRGVNCRDTPPASAWLAAPAHNVKLNGKRAPTLDEIELSFRGPIGRHGRPGAIKVDCALIWANAQQTQAARARNLNRHTHTHKLTLALNNKQQRATSSYVRAHSCVCLWTQRSIWAGGGVNCEREQSNERMNGNLCLPARNRRPLLAAAAAAAPSAMSTDERRIVNIFHILERAEC